MNRPTCSISPRRFPKAQVLVGLVLVAGLASSLILTSSSRAASSFIPRLVSYQGLLTDDLGNLVADANYSIRFRIYTKVTGGALLWDETQIVATSGGIFDVVLGEVTPIDPIFFSNPVWLSIAIDGQSPLSPRSPLTTSPYSFRAAGLEDGALTPGMIGSSTLVRSLNGIRNTVHLVAGSNVTISEAGQNITISSTGGGTGGDDGDWTISGAHLYRDGNGSVAIGTSTVQPWSANQTMLQVGATIFPTIALDRVGGSFQRWMLMHETLSNTLWIGPAASATSPPAGNLIITADGKVGVGMTPVATFNVTGGNGDLSTSAGDFAIGGGSTVFKMGLTTSGSSAGLVQMRAVSTSTPSIAIGVADHDVLRVNDTTTDFYGDAPSRIARLRSDSAGAQGGILELYGHVPTFRTRISLDAQNGSNATISVRQDNGASGVRVSAGAAGSGGEILLYDGAGNEEIRIDSSYAGGAGRIRTPTLEITGGSDLSEQFRIHSRAIQDPRPKPGMVVAVDPDHPGELMLTETRYDRRVAGVISGAGGIRPGMVMRQRESIADGTHPVALTGRVYVWVDASQNPIEPGDLLTTSSTAGHAMKVLDHNRAVVAIIGKAMTRLESGRGLVLALVSLQ